MAKPKQAHSVIVLPKGGIHVWTDDPKRAAFEIENVEGVAQALARSIGLISVYLDPRYDTDEVAEEIRILLASEVPDIFREE